MWKWYQLSRTETFRAELQAWVAQKRIASLLDAPCGDYNWMRHVQFPDDFRYVGGDIVGELIAANRRRFPGVHFVEMDIISDALPAVDAWLCRDAMIHFPNASVSTVIERFCGSNLDTCSPPPFRRSRQTAISNSDNTGRSI